MSLLAKIFGAVPKEERAGISMGDSAGWEVSGIKGKSFPDFLCALASLLPDGSILYLEDTSQSAREILAFLESHAASGISKVALGTIWPRPRFFHIAITPPVMQELARLVEHHPTPEIAIHIHAYRGSRVLLEWHDAFFDPLRISRDIPADRVAEFCQRLDAKYERVEPHDEASRLSDERQG